MKKYHLFFLIMATTLYPFLIKNTFADYYLYYSGENLLNIFGEEREQLCTPYTIKAKTNEEIVDQTAGISKPGQSIDLKYKVLPNNSIAFSPVKQTWCRIVIGNETASSGAATLKFGDADCEITITRSTSWSGYSTYNVNQQGNACTFNKRNGSNSSSNNTGELTIPQEQICRGSQGRFECTIKESRPSPGFYS